MTALRVVTDPAIEQRFAALDDANEIRVGKCDIRKHIQSLGRAGSFELANLLSDPPRSLRNVLAFSLMQYVSRVGASKAEYLLRRADVDSWTKVSALTDRERARLTFLLTEYGHDRLTFTYKKPRPPRPPRPAVVADPARIPVRQNGLVCGRCGEHLRVRSDLCGFCENEESR